MNSRDTDDRLAATLRQALQEEAAMVVPTDRLEEIRRQTSSPRHPWVPWLAAAAAAAVVGTGVGLAVTHNRSPQIAGPGPIATAPAPVSTAEKPSGSSTGATSAPEAPNATLPVYVLGQQGSRAALFREFRPGTASDAAEKVQAAVQSALTGKPADPDYFTPWAAGSAATTSVGASRIQIELNQAAAASPIKGDTARLAIHQLVWTADAAAGASLPVQITVAGGAGQLFGTSLANPFTRATGTDDPRALIWIIDPAQGATFAAGSKITVNGDGVNAYENTIAWTLTRGSTQVANGHFGVSGPGGAIVDVGQRGAWSLQLTLSAGTYTLTAFLPDPSGGESTVKWQDTKTFTVH